MSEHLPEVRLPMARPPLEGLLHLLGERPRAAALPAASTWVRLRVRARARVRVRVGVRVRVRVRLGVGVSPPPAPASARARAVEGPKASRLLTWSGLG